MKLILDVLAKIILLGCVSIILGLLLFVIIISFYESWFFGILYILSLLIIWAFNRAANRDLF